MSQCCFQESQSTFFTNDNPLWQVLIGLLGASIAIIALQIQNNIQKKAERKKIAVEISSLFAEKSTVLINFYKNFLESYGSSMYYIATLHIFTSEFEKQAVISQSEQAIIDWKANRAEQHKTTGEIIGILNKYKIYFEENEKIDSLLIKISNSKSPEFPKLEPGRTLLQVNEIKRNYELLCKTVVDSIRIDLDSIAKILKENAKQINKK
ncbi:hypothetical protein [Flavobacterium sp. FlaQc-30]|uniref:hypothetical protein n=1 Tax=Flavobacterium sp. FlaQc-30 TaxID=3374179 RepID=UPI0037583475